MRNLREGRWRHLARFGCLTLVLGVVFGLIDSDFASTPNWVGAVAGGFGYAVVRGSVEEYGRRKRRKAADASSNPG